MRARPLLTALALVAVSVTPPVTASTYPCRDVQTSAVVESAVIRPRAQQGAELPLPAIYSAVEYQSRPASTYAVAGPYTLGVFEGTPFDPDSVPGAAFGLIPVPVPIAPPAVDTPLEPVPQPPPYGRAEAAYPVETIPDDSSASWGPGRSAARVDAAGGSARASGVVAGSGSTPSVESAGSWSVTRFECAVLTVVAGWTATGITHGGGRIDSISQTLTMAVGPTGSRAEVVTDAGRPGGADGQPLAPFTDPFNAQSRQTVEVGEPRVETGNGFARVSGGAVRISFGDPERSDQRIEFRLGSIEAAVQIEGEFFYPSGGMIVEEGPTEVRNTSPSRREFRSESGQPPEPSPQAVAAGTEALRTASRSRDYRVDAATDAGPVLLGLVGLLALVAAATGAAVSNRDRWPTAAFALDRSAALGRRFRDTYLRW